ncbi:TPA: RNA-protein complex protein Nop10 [archaeon]|nr:RNA-protein complex protein Nop10 [Candidatus Naiadarchaeales archaeon SRR2090153.bin461]HIK02474.1 RNA-protein complex protein Nop10 [Candidatus Naiadarchaeales archaeon SRR2090159.bin1288]
MSKILKCKKCSTYTMQAKCPNCGAATITAEPAKFSPDDKYGKHRRLYKKQLAMK